MRRAIIDRGVSLAPQTVIGHDLEHDRERGFRVTDKGIVLVTPDMLRQSVHVVR